MQNGENDFVLGLRNNPMMGNRPVCEPCWNNRHDLCGHQHCQCLHHEQRAPRKRPAKEVEEILAFPIVGGITQT